MNKGSNNFTNEEIFRLYEQSELSDIINEDRSNYMQKNKTGTVGRTFPFLYTLVSAGFVAGALSFITLLRRYKLF